jgi:hypothetical protein
MVITHPDFAYYSKILPHSVEGGTFKLTRASRIVADPTKKIVLRDSRRAEDCIAVPFIPGSELPCDPGFAIEIPANSLVDEAGNPPSGSIEVKLATVEIHTESMPAPVFVAASDTDPTAIAVMTPYGAGMVETRDVRTGRGLNLAPGRRARITIPVHRVAKQRSGSATAPANIPLLRFNETSLRWVQIGEMPLTGAGYSAEVDHLSTFNADVTQSAWGCVLVQFAGAVPPQLINPLKPVTIVVADSAYAFNSLGGATGPVVPLSFTTQERGASINLSSQVLYGITAGHNLKVHAADGSTRLSPYAFLAPVVAQTPANPPSPIDPSATCTPLLLVWNPSTVSSGGGSLGNYVPISGVITYASAVGVVRSLQDRTVIGRISAGERVWAIGILKQDPSWLLVQTLRGQVGVAPRKGADLSRTRSVDGEVSGR